MAQDFSMPQTIPTWIADIYRDFVETRAYGSLTIKFEAGNPTTARPEKVIPAPKKEENKPRGGKA